MCGLVAGASEDLSGARIDVDPDDAAAAHELPAIDAGAGIELGAEIIASAHTGEDTGFAGAQRQEMAVASAILGRLPLAVALPRIVRGLPRR